VPGIGPRPPGPSDRYPSCHWQNVAQADAPGTEWPVAPHAGMEPEDGDTRPPRRRSTWRAVIDPRDDGTGAGGRHRATGGHDTSGSGPQCCTALKSAEPSRSNERNPSVRTEIYWVVTAALRPESYEAMKQVITPLVEATRKEPGSNAYDYSVNADRTAVHIYESYRDSQAVVTHVRETFSRFAEEFSALLDINGFVVYGWPDEAAKEILDGFGAVYMTPFVGFTQSDGA
jgi:quinol monooxygenase YgiN